MKKTLLISMLSLLGMTQTVAQDYEYVPFVREGVKWVYAINTINLEGGPNKTVYHLLELKGDKLINGKTYKAMHMYSGNAIDDVNDTIPIYLREEDKVVYGIVPEGTKVYPECPVGNLYTYFTATNDIEECYHGDEFVLYDFQNFEGYFYDMIEDMPWINSTVFDIEQDYATVGSHLAKEYKLGNDCHFIEGIGTVNSNSGYTIYPIVPKELSTIYDVFNLSHVIEGGKIVYKAMNYDGNMTGIDEVVADKGQRAYDGTYYNLMGQPVGKEVPTTPGIYIHNGNKILVR